MQERALARTMIVREMLRIWAVTNSPLCSLLYGEEAKLTVTFAGRRLPFPHLRTDAFRGFSRTVTDKEYLFQSWNRLLGPSNDNSVAD